MMHVLLCTYSTYYVEGLEFRVDNHNLYIIEFLDVELFHVVANYVCTSSFQLSFSPLTCLQISVHHFHALHCEYLLGIHVTQLYIVIVYNVGL